MSTVVQDLHVGARLLQFWETWEALGAGPKVLKMLKEGYTLPFWTRPNLTMSPTIISCYVNPHSSHYLLEALLPLMNKNALELVKNKKCQPTIFGSQTKLPVKTYTRPRQSEQVPQGRKIQNGDTRNNKDLPPDRGVGEVHRFQGRLHPYTHSKPIQEVLTFSRPGSSVPVYSTTVWSVNSTHGVYCSGKGGQINCITKGYKNPPVPKRLVGQSQIPPNLSPAYTDSSSYVRI